MDYAFEIASIRFEVEYRKVKVLRITVYPPDGRVKIAAPPSADRETIVQFAASKIKWIEKHRERFLNHSKLTGPLKNHSGVYLWGRILELEIIERAGNTKIIVEDGGVSSAPGSPGASGVPFGRMKMFARPGSTKAKKEELLDKWYRGILKETAPAIIKKWENRIGVEVKKLYVRKMKTHWGSCNYEKQTLRLNSELVKRSPECLEYVIVHEMIHIIEKSHNRVFYRLLARCLPDWKAIRKKMNAGL